VGIWLEGAVAHLSSVAAIAGAAALAAIGIAFSPRTGALLCVLLSWIGIGIGAASLEAAVRIPPGLIAGDSVRLEGRVETITPIGDSVRVEVAVARAPDLMPSEARFQVRLYAPGPLVLYPGQRILFPTRLRTDAPVANPGQWDSTGYRRRRALIFSGPLDPRRVVVLSAPAPWRVWLRSSQERLSARVHQLSPTPEAASLYLTMAAGLRAELGEELETQFAISGLAHVLSVSGLHVAALALLALKMTRFLVVRCWRGSRCWDARRVAAALALPIVWAYVIYTGNQPPAVRSAVMSSVVMLGMSTWRRADPLNSLAIAAIALLAVDPSGVADLSLQLSFAAVISLILLTPAIREAIPIAPPDPGASGPWRYRLRKQGEEALQVFCASVAVALAGLPLIAATFHRVSFAGLVSNIICLPLCGLLTALAAGGAAAFVIAPWASVPLLFAGTWASQLLVWLVQLFAALPGASHPIPALGPWRAFAFFGGLIAFGIGQGRWRWVSVAVPLVLISLHLPWQSQHGLRVVFLSVGHGDAIVLSSLGRHALVDGGGTPGGADTGRKYVLPFLRESRVDHLELAVLSHPHPDHALGLISTLAEVYTRRLWVPAETGGELTAQVVKSARGAVAEEVQRGIPPLPLGEATIEVLGPPVDKVLLKGVNDRSIVLRVRHRQVTFLLTGDIEEAGEEVLEPGPTTVLKVPHHGSATSSSAPFLQKTLPRFVIFCVGRDNRFRFPNTEIEDRYRSIGSECFRTDLDGAVTFESDGHDVRWKTFLPHVRTSDLARAAAH
jgi:competence protein ComEC